MDDRRERLVVLLESLAHFESRVKRHIRCRKLSVLILHYGMGFSCAIINIVFHFQILFLN